MKSILHPARSHVFDPPPVAGHRSDARTHGRVRVLRRAGRRRRGLRQHPAQGCRGQQAHQGLRGEKADAQLLVLAIEGPALYTPSALQAFAAEIDGLGRPAGHHLRDVALQPHLLRQGRRRQAADRPDQPRGRGPCRRRGDRRVPGEADGHPPGAQSRRCRRRLPACRVLPGGKARRLLRAAEGARASVARLRRCPGSPRA